MLDPTVFIAQGAVVVGDVHMGKESSVWYNAVVRGDMAPVYIGDQTNIQDLSMLHVGEGYPCTIGNRVTVGHRAILHGCTVEDDCLIGMGAILLNGAHVGAGSVVGAGAVIMQGKTVPPGSLILGMPARVLRPVDNALRQRVDLSWKHYATEANNHRSGLVPLHPVSRQLTANTPAE